LEVSPAIGFREGLLRYGEEIVLKVEVHCGDCGAKLEASDGMCSKCGSRGPRYSILMADSAEMSPSVQTKQRNSADFLRKLVKSWAE
jgi:predicted amidophosphoribosyltransferase